MSRWRRIEQRMYADAKFCALSAPQPNGQSLWIWLITGPRTHIIPGVVIGNEMELAGALRWPLEGFREAFAEVQSMAMAEADWNAGLVWLPRGPHHQPPQSANVVTSWGKEWEFVPECELKLVIFQQLGDYLEGKGEAFAKAFAEAFAKPSPIQKQKQKQEQKQDPEPSRPPAATEERDHPAPRLSRVAADKPDLFGEFWQAYPKREAKVVAERAFRRLSLTDQRAAIDGIARWLDSGRWDDRQFVPQPATYLNRRRWEDEITPAATAPRTSDRGRFETPFERVQRLNADPAPQPDDGRTIEGHATPVGTALRGVRS